MGVVLLDGNAVRNFALDEAALIKAVDPQFKELDVNNDGVLSRSELRVALERLNLLETVGGFPVSKTPEELNALYQSAFEMFDMDHDGKVDLAEFREQLKQILLAVADGLGSSPMEMVVDDDSLLHAVVDREEEASSKKP
ncbi:uncharacterized protein LOC9640617 [Selaginella moellendorffii]|nr:uncharacterized protein LOC9640617 [Selaginella moellendorffii]|eukprot:XP_002972188.2 uncharacterized protein LOC9640617 [Selaginella moellendorffii]